MEERVDLRRRYETWTTERLLEVVHPDAGYLPDAVAVATDVLGQRGVDVESPEAKAILAEVDTAQAEMAERRTAPLHIGLKIFCAVLPGLAALIISGYNFSSGRPQAGADALKWTAIGVLAYAVIGFFFT